MIFMYAQKMISRVFHLYARVYKIIMTFRERNFFLSANAKIDEKWLMPCALVTRTHLMAARLQITAVFAASSSDARDTSDCQE